MGKRVILLLRAGLQVGANSSADRPLRLSWATLCLWRTVPVGFGRFTYRDHPGRGAQMVRSAGGAALLMSRDEATPKSAFLQVKSGS